ncbi:hypothetical protein [Roseovarius sp. MBR-6]|uniref:hypothetical protein n=1 Tax=Roseovarius sp. MBR-6 TaxID=3156459 RepID=UPI003397C496
MDVVVLKDWVTETKVTPFRSGESFTFTVHAVYLPRPRIDISGPQGVQATFDWQAARDSVVGRMCTATLVNDVETY